LLPCCTTNKKDASASLRTPIDQRPELSIGGFKMSKYSDLAPEGFDGTYYYANVGFKL